MSYLARLKAEKGSNTLTPLAVKTLERHDVTPFERFEGDQGKRIPAHDREERAAIMEHDAGMPRAWADAFARIVEGPAPDDFEPGRWQSTLDGALRFADEWAGRAHALGWSADELFGLDPLAPSGRVDRRGLAFLLGKGSWVVSIDKAGADLITAGGARQRYYRRPS